MAKINIWLRCYAETGIRWLPLIAALAVWLVNLGFIILLNAVAYASDCPPGGFDDCANAATTAQNPVIPGMGSLLGAGIRAWLGANPRNFRLPNMGTPPVPSPPTTNQSGAANQPGKMMPDGHTVLPPEEDPYRLTDYPDFLDWLKRTIYHADQTGQPLPPSVEDLLRRHPGLMPMGHPSNWTFPAPLVDTIIESGEVAMGRLRGFFPGRVIVPGQWVEVPTPMAGLPGGLHGIGYNTITLPGGQVVFDPNSTTIVRDWHHPSHDTAIKTTIPPGDARALANQLNTLVRDPALEGFNLAPVLDSNGEWVLPVPENIPPGVQNIAHGVKDVWLNGQWVTVFDTSGPVIASAW